MSSPVRRLSEWDGSRLERLARYHGTPLYVQDLERVRANYERLSESFPESDVLYAAKANTAKAVLKTLAKAGAGIECASAGEVERALTAGCAPENVQYTAVNPPSEDLDYAVSVAQDHPELTINVGARDTIDRLEEREFYGRLCLRVNPGVGAGHHEKVSTGANAKFGIPISRAPTVLEEASENGFDVVGIHAHAGSGISGEDLGAHRELVSRMGKLAREVELDLEFVDIGGGFGVPYHPGQKPLDLDAVAEATREALGEVDATLTVEPGRYLVADAGVLLARINTVKPVSDELIVGIDAGMSTLARPALYDAHHEIKSVEAAVEKRSTTKATVTGPICESGDVFGTYDLPAPERGDLLAIGNAGAYGYEMASQYNSRPRPATVVIDGENSAVDRRRETVSDVTRLDQGAPWL